ncbi:MAG: nucleotidyltransferase family protein [Candidatus Latescibacterota bacterium]|nr:nucleotidyltransferase family protein [Candidatus Latescibacterota bacterium]
MRVNLDSVSVSPVTSIREVMEGLNQSQKGLALVLSEDSRLLGTVTDGDIRRALLAGLDLDSPVQDSMQTEPTVAPDGLDEAALLNLMRANGVRHLPIVNGAGRVVALQYLDLTESSPGTVSAVVMAGGEGLRLRPLTEDVPKPMLPVGDRPILQILIDCLKLAGVTRVFLSVGYLKEQIQEYFGDGEALGLDVHYLVESKPCGTAGALSLIPKELRPESPFLVINGDLITRLNFGAFRDFHIAAGYDFTLCCRPYEVKIPFGYPVIDEDRVVEFKEKPTFHYLVNSGIYCLSESLFDMLPARATYNMTDLIQEACSGDRRVGVFPLREPFHEIGREESYRDAEAFFAQHFVDDSTD